MSRKNKKINKKLGFSLLELILAIAVFSIGSFALATLLIDSNISTKLSTERINALLYAKEGIGAVQSIRNSGWAALTDGNHGLSHANSSWSFVSSSDLIDNKYTRVISIANTPGANPATSSKTVTSNVSWNLTPVRIASTTITTILTNWGNK